MPDRTKAQLSGLSIERRLEGRKLLLSGENLESLILEAPQSFVEQSNRFLRNLGRLVIRPGPYFAMFPIYHCPYGFAEDPAELAFLIRELHDEGLIEVGGIESGRIRNTEYLVTVPEFQIRPTGKGWAALRDLEKSDVQGTNAFVAMWFDDSLEEVYINGIEPAVMESGHRAVRMDKMHHSNRIDAEIMVQIQRAKLIVADFTGQRQGVYFEAGFAVGLKKPVIWLCRQDEKESLHFDTRQYNHIFWTTSEDLRRELQARIELMVGKGPLVPREG